MDRGRTAAALVAIRGAKWVIGAAGKE